MSLRETFISFRNSGFPDKQTTDLMNRRQNLVTTVETLLYKVDSGDQHAVEDYLDRSKNKKGNIYRILKEFDRYLKKNNMGGIPFLPDKTFYDSDAEIKFEILKLIHKPMKASEIGEILSMDEDSVNKHISML